MTKYPTYEHRMAAIEVALDKVRSMPVTPILLFNIKDTIQNQMLQLFQFGEISKVPIVKVEQTVTGSTVNGKGEWILVYDDTSLTVNFIDPDTMETI